MPGENNKIAAAIKKLAQTGDQVYSEVGKVTELDREERTCTVEPTNGDAPILEVNLQANIMLEGGVVMYPEIGSDVIVSFLSVENAYISAYSDMSDIVINNGQNGGLININTLIAELNKNNAILNAILSVLGGAPIPEAGLGAPSALQVALNGVTAALQVGSFSNMEDDKVTH
jgi:hypothetical protein